MLRGLRIILMVVLAGAVLAGPAMARDKDVARKKAHTKLQRRNAWLKALRKHVAEKFERVNSETDLLRGFATYSVQTDDGPRAYVFIHWGDLDNKLKEISPDYYSNWDGVLEIEGGTARVVKEVAFDDGSPRPEKLTDEQLEAKAAELKQAFEARAAKRLEVAKARARRRIKNPAKLERALAELEEKFGRAIVKNDARVDKGVRAIRKHRQPGEGSGVDKLVEDGPADRLEWKAGVVGATDGLLFRLDLEGPEATVFIKAGEHTIMLESGPRPAGGAEPDVNDVEGDDDGGDTGGLVVQPF